MATATVPPASPSAWICPRGAGSVLVRRVDDDCYRGGPPRLVELGAVPMPAMAPHLLDLADDLLVFVDRGVLTVLRGLLDRPRVQRSVKIPGRPAIHALHWLDAVVYTGGEGGRGMLGYVDLREEPLCWRDIDVPPAARRYGKSVDGFARRGDRLIAVDDLAVPRYFLLLDVADPRAPRMVEARDFGERMLLSRVVSTAAEGDVLALLTHSGGRGRFETIELLELPDLTTFGWLSVRVDGRDGPRFRAVAMRGEYVLIAAGAAGLGVFRVPPRAAAPVSLTPDAVRFVPLPGLVVDVIVVDDTHAFAVVEHRRRGLFRARQLGAVLVDWSPAR